MEETKSTPPSNRVDDDITHAFAEVAKDEVYTTATDQIQADVNNASSMLSFIVNRGIDIKKELIESVVNAKNQLAHNKWNQNTEIEFYMTYKELTKLIRPVTVNSLISSAVSNKPSFLGKLFGKQSRDSLSKRSVTGYTICTAISVILLLSVQIYFYLGSTRINNINNTYAEQDKIIERQKELSVILENAPNNIIYTTEMDELSSRYTELDNIKQSNIDLLSPWSQYIRKITFNTTIRTDTMPKSDKLYMKANTAIIQEAKGYVLILGIYVLPLLYGVIGGFTFVLRELTSDIKNLTFSQESNIKYVLRIVLGAIAGLSVGLFWGDIENVQTFGLSSLSPILLAFLGGYCVEYLLQFIEKIVMLFFNKFDSDKKQEGAKEHAKPKVDAVKSEEQEDKEDKK